MGFISCYVSDRVILYLSHSHSRYSVVKYKIGQEVETTISTSGEILDVDKESYPTHCYFIDDGHFGGHWYSESEIKGFV